MAIKQSYIFSNHSFLSNSTALAVISLNKIVPRGSVGPVSKSTQL